MPFDQSRTAGVCPVCKGPANIVDTFLTFGVNCSCCGDFQVDRATIDDVGLPFTDPKAQALARYIIKKMQAPGTRPALTTDFFRSLHDRTLPTPTERSDNLLIWLAEQADGRLGNPIEIKRGDPGLYTIIGVIGELDIDWIVDSLQAQGLVLSDRSGSSYYGTLTAQGWQRVEELKRAHVSSSYAFFARKFENQELDEVFNKCLRLAVKQTGYELRPATQRAGLVDSVIEDEIRRCRFLVADLSDENAGAYWEAGFAEGLGKPVIYLCRAKDGEFEKKIHFDVDHRHTVRWDLSSLDNTAVKLKAVIRNTLLGDAKQTD